MNALRRALYRIDDACAAVEDLLIIVAHGTIALLILLAVFRRYAMNNPLTWGEDLIVGIFTWMIFLGSAAAIRSHMHIRIDVMAAVYKHPKMRWLNMLTLVLGLVILLVMIYACLELVSQEASVDLPMLGISKAWFLVSAPTGLALMVLHSVRIWVEEGAEVAFRGETEVI